MQQACNDTHKLTGGLHWKPPLASWIPSLNIIIIIIIIIIITTPFWE